ncbi:type II secretion system F family protein [candidate division CSSED10-310 bacterium]|uniref:Type II secretion system F family protein n=1 Tax=candidate division CSSED10-310 bacterium TaxID=2855610 RepID=A0ABV6YW73_UNCC1
MPEFKWKGVDRSGKEKSGVMEADTSDIVSAHLRRQGINATSVKKKKGDIEIVIPGVTNRVSGKDLVVFTRTFSTMIDAGLPLVQCLEILSQQTENPTLAKTVKEVKNDVESGMTYADALRKHPKQFDSLYCNMVEAGETGGILDTILGRLASHMEKSLALKRQVKSAMTYPLVIITVAVAVIILLLTKVIPTFVNIFTQLGGDLPLPTQIIMMASEFTSNYIVFILVGIAAAIFGFKAQYKTERGRYITDSIYLKLPVFGMLLRKVAVAKFTRTLSTLMSSGVPILDGLEITARTAGNAVVEEAVLKTRASISEGKTIAEPLAETDVFPPMVVQMISVGESTGALDAMLSKIADFYDEEVDIAVSNLTQLLEPMLMVFLGVTIGGVVIAMYLPMFALIGAMQSV